MGMIVLIFTQLSVIITGFFSRIIIFKHVIVNVFLCNNYFEQITDPYTQDYY